MMFVRVKGDVELKEFGGIDSKFRYVIVAALRAKELLRGSKPKIKTKSKNLIRVAQEEVRRGLIEYRIIPPGEREVLDSGDGMYIGEEIGMEGIDLIGGPAVEKPEFLNKSAVSKGKTQAMNLEERMKQALKKKHLPEEIEEPEQDLDEDADEDDDKDESDGVEENDEDDSEDDSDNLDKE